MTQDEIIEQFNEKAVLLQKNDAASVPLVIAQARLMVALRTKARKNWEKTCEKRLKTSPRVARRLLKIGEKWSTPDRTPGSDLLDKLPFDLHKLEAICELPLDQLQKLSDDIDFRKLERTEVTAKVKALLGTPSAATSNTSPLVSVLNRWDSFAARVASDVKKLDIASRQEFADELDSLMTELRESLDEAVITTSLPGAAEATTKVPEEDGEPEKSNEAAASPHPRKDDKPIKDKSTGKNRRNLQPA